MYSNEASWLDTNGDQQTNPAMLTDLNQDGVQDIVAMVDIDGDGQRNLVVMTDIDQNQIPELFLMEDQDGDGQIEPLMILNENQVPNSFKYSDSSSPWFNTEESQLIVGNPLDDMEHWQMQQSPDTCAVVCQEYVLNDLAEQQGLDFTEAELVQVAANNGWYVPGGGTPLAYTGNLLEAYGIPVERTSGSTLEDLAEKLNRGEKVIVGVDGDEVFEPGINPTQDDLFGDWDSMTGFIPGQHANHAVQVIGIDRSNPDQPVVILNDPGQPQGKGFRIPADEFIDAWKDSDNFMVSTALHNA